MREDLNDINVNEIVVECHNLGVDISDLSEDLNSVSEIKNININDEIVRVTEVLGEVNEKIKNVILDEEHKKTVLEKFENLKTECVALKNKHVALYNEKVKFINQRINELTTGITDANLSDDIKNELAKLSTIEECKTFINGDWQQTEYLKTLDYDKLDEMYKSVTDIEKKLKISSNEPLELWSRWNYINETLEEIKKEVKEGMSATEINELLNKCISSFEKIVDLDIIHELKRDDLSKEIFAKYSDKISKLNESYKKLETDLLERKNKVDANTSDYEKVNNQIEQLSSKFEIISRKANEYRGKCTEKVIAVFNNNLNELQEELESIKTQIDEYKKNGTLDPKQIENLEKKIEELSNKHDNAKSAVNLNPFMLKGVDDFAYFSSKLDDLDLLLTQLYERIFSLESPVKDKNIRKEINEILKAREKEIRNYDKNLLKFYKDTEPEKYKKLKEKLDGINVKFDKTCKMWNGKHPLKVVGVVKDAGRFFKKHPKLTLIMAGLAAVALIHATVGPVIIPAIMHGNIMIGSSTPALRGIVKFINRILGGVIGAHRTSEGLWILASGAAINPALGTSSLLKGLAISGVGTTALGISTTALVAPIILEIKKLIEKMKKGELKQRLEKQNKEEKEKKRKEDKEKKKKEKEEKNSKKEFDKLLEKYLDQARTDADMTFDDFCKKNNLTEEQRQQLLLELKKIAEKLNVPTETEEERKARNGR